MRSLLTKMTLTPWLILTLWSFVFTQTPTKVIEWQEKPVGSNNERWADGTQTYRLLDRVEIEEFRVGVPVRIGEPFSADDDWLQKLVIRVRNTSGQKIASIQITLGLPQMGNTSPDVVYCYGCAPDEKAKGIAPGESVELKMPGGGMYEFVKGRATEVGGISQINKAQIKIMYVTLPDKTLWVSGCIKTTDVKNACAK